MMFKLAIKESLDRKFRRLQSKDKEMLRLIEKKVNEILADLYRFKPLRKPLQYLQDVTLCGAPSPNLPTLCFLPLTLCPVMNMYGTKLEPYFFGTEQTQ